MSRAIQELATRMDFGPISVLASLAKLAAKDGSDRRGIRHASRYAKSNNQLVRLVRAAQEGERIASSACTVSVASLWEVPIKHRLGTFSVSPQVFRDEMRNAGAAILSVTDAHAVACARLPTGHGNPFD